MLLRGFMWVNFSFCILKITTDNLGSQIKGKCVYYNYRWRIKRLLKVLCFCPCFVCSKFYVKVCYCIIMLYLIIEDVTGVTLHVLQIQ